MAITSRLWTGLPLVYKLVTVGLGTVLIVTGAVMLVTFLSAEEGLKLQMERQLSRDLNVVEAWYRARLEEIQLTALGLARQREMQHADTHPTAAATLLRSEARRLGLDLALRVDATGRVLASAGAHSPARFDPDGLISRALAGQEQRVTTEALADIGLVRLVITPIGAGALILGERVGAGSVVPRQLTTMIGGAVALLDREAVLAGSGFPADIRPVLSPAVWASVREGRYFFAEQGVGGRAYLMAFRPLLDHRGRPVGAIARAFPEEEISETLLRFAGGIVVISSAALLFALVAFLVLTRRLLEPLRRLAAVSSSLAATPVPQGLGRDEVGSLAHGVAMLADKLSQSREELATAALRLEAEAAARARLIERIITAQEDERKRIARELHDQTGQALTGLLVGLKYVEGAPTLEAVPERTEALKRLTVQTLEEVHQLSVALRPPMLDDLGLVVALRALVEDFGTKQGVDAHFTADMPAYRLPPLHEVTLYRIAQEALTNVAKYAQARRLDVTLRVADRQMSLTVADDGVGFDPVAVDAAHRPHLGLLGMSERVALLGGHLSLDSAPGKGTRLAVTATLEGVPPHG